MRLMFKFSAIVLMAVFVQCNLVRCVDELDEAAFVCRVLVARAEGRAPDDEALMEHATRLLERRLNRAGLSLPSGWDAPVEVELASVDAS